MIDLLSMEAPTFEHVGLLQARNNCGNTDVEQLSLWLKGLMLRAVETLL